MLIRKINVGIRVVVWAWPPGIGRDTQTPCLERIGRNPVYFDRKNGGIDGFSA